MKKGINMNIKSLGSVFKLYLFILEAYVNTVCTLHHSHYANDIKSYQAIILNRIVKTLKTLNHILEEFQDPFSGYCLLRTIADSVCSYCFIYENDDSDEVEFRHYLFLLDGCSQIVNVFPSALFNNLENTERENIQIEIDQERIFLNDFREKLLGYIQNTHIVLTSPNKTDIIIRNRDWKYRSINSYSKKESYSWQDLYKEARFNTFTVNFLSTFLSQYVHGLFLSNSKNSDSPIHNSLIYDFIIPIEHRLIEAILKCFKNDNLQEKVLNHLDLNKMRDLDIDNNSILKLLKV